MTKDQRGYILVSLACGGLGADSEMQKRATRLLAAFSEKNPQYKKASA